MVSEVPDGASMLAGAGSPSATAPARLDWSLMTTTRVVV